MLDALHRSASSWAIKILFLILILSFSIWGVSNYIIHQPFEKPAITVGDIAISMSAMQEEFNRDVAQLRVMLGQTALTAEDARRMGFMHRTVQHLVTSATLDMAAHTYGLVAPDELLVATVRRQAEFQDAAGRFDSALFRHTVAASGQSEEAYFQNLRQRLLRVQVVSTIMDYVTVPTILVDYLYRQHHEKRVAEIVTLPIAAMLALPPPNQATLEAFHKAHAVTFTTPEYRKFSAILLTASAVAPLVSITEEAVREAYNDSLPAFRTHEIRTVEQVLSASREQAKAVLMRVKDGQLAQTAGDTQHSVTLLGRLNRAEIDQINPAMAEAIFTAELGKVVGPLQSVFGWHLFQVTAIAPAETTPFEIVRDKIRGELLDEKTGDVVYELSGRMEDAINRGISIEEAARQIGLTISTFAPVDRFGIGMNGEIVSGMPPTRAFLPTAFTLVPGTQSMMTESEGGFFVVRADAIIPSRLKPVDEVRQALIDQWTIAQRREATHGQAEAVVERLRAGISLHEAIKNSAGIATVSKPFLRTDTDTQLPPAFIARLFNLAVGETVVEETAETFIVGRLQAVFSPAADAAAHANLKREVTNQYAEDMLTQFTAALGRAFKVTVNPRILASDTREPVRP